jgi:hypothetical protein
MRSLLALLIFLNLGASAQSWTEVPVKKQRPADERQKGYVFYYSRQGSSVHQIIDPATIIYRYELQEVPCDNYGEAGCYIKRAGDMSYAVRKDWVKTLWKILVKGKPFDLNKKYQFIREEELAK